MEVTLVLYDGCSAWGAFGCQEILQFANGSYKYYNKVNEDFFRITLVSARNESIKTRYGTEIKTEKTIDQIEKTDLIIIPGTSDNINLIIQNNPEFIKWIKEKHFEGTQFATYCTGTFFLAAAGLLEGKKAVTHWLKETEFLQMFPDTCLQSQNIILDENNFLMGGGSSSYHNLMIYLTEKYMSKQIAVFISKLLLVDIYKDVQTSYSIFIGQKQHNDEQVLKTQELIEKNYAQKFSLEDLYANTLLSERSFLRRFKKATGNTPLQYIQRVKVEAAKKMLEHENLTFEEIVRAVGYEDVSSFRKLFKKFTGIAPQVYKKKYQFNYL